MSKLPPWEKDPVFLRHRIQMKKRLIAVEKRVYFSSSDPGVRRVCVRHREEHREVIKRDKKLLEKCLKRKQGSLL